MQQSFTEWVVFAEVLGEVASSNEKNKKTTIPDFVSENRVPLDRETILNSSDYLKTKIKVKGASVYKNGDNYFYRDTLHVGGRAHLEVFNKKGVHVGEADPVTGKLIEGTADKTKKLNLK